MEAVEMKVRVDKETRDQVNSIAQSLGMSVNTAITVFLKQFISHRGFPFEVVQAEPVMTRDEFTDEMERRYQRMKAGQFVEHDLIEE